MKYNKKFYEKYGIKVTEEAIQKIEDKKLDRIIQRMHENVENG